MPVGDVYRTVVHGQLHLQQTNNVFFHRVSVDAGGINPGSVAEAFRSNVQANWKGAVSAEWSWVQVCSQMVLPTPPSLTQCTPAGAGVGSVAGGSLPTSMAAVIRRKTAFAGRKFRGRTYIAGVPVGGEDDSKLTVAQKTLLETLAAVLDNDLTIGGSTLEPWIVGRVPPDPGPPPVPGFYVTRAKILSTQVDDILRNQRRRQVGKGI